MFILSLKIIFFLFHCDIDINLFSVHTYDWRS